MAAKDTFKIEPKHFFIGGGILVGVITGIIIYTQKKQKQSAVKRTKGASGGGTGFCKYGDSYPLKVGSCGKNVTALQKRLVALGVFIGGYGAKGNGVDGKFGRDTEKGVKKAIGRSTITRADMDNLNSLVKVS